MELKICMLLMLICGCFLVAGVPKLTPRRYFHPLEAPNEETAKKINAHVEEKIEETWEKSTKVEDEPPSFFSESFDSNITGKTMVTFLDRTIYAFQGFRYGLGDRFKPPKPVDKFWEGDNFNATHIGFKCPQGAIIGSQPAGNEDCLFLNVYTPYIPKENMEKLPVIHFIHGGGFTFGDSSTYMPTRLLDHDVILVVIHYRLGAFGFYTLNNEDAPGNIALYDMVESLRWTHRHIADFGGDPEKVTVMGESAGSVSANYMMIVEPAEGLFRAVIAESGSCLDHWAIDTDPSFAAHYIASYVGCDKDSDEDTFECMYEVPFEELVKAQGNLSATDEHNGLMGFRGVSPTIQTFNLSDDADYELIFTKPARKYFTDRDFTPVPFLTGANKQEGSLVVSIMYASYMVYNNLTTNQTYMREQMVQDILNALGIYDDTRALAISLQNFYCKNVDMTNVTEAAPCLIDMTGVLFLKAGSWEVANYHSYYSDQPTYYYSFEFESDDSLFNYVGSSLPFDGGVTHADELMYLFSLPAIMDYPGQVETVDRMTTMWTNFATYLDPTPFDQRDELAAKGIPIWTPYEFEDHHFLVIANNLAVMKEFPDRWTITLDELRANQTNCTGICADYKEQMEDYKEERDEYKEERDEYKAERDEYKDQSDDYKAARDEYKEERDDYKEERDEYKEERDDYRNERDEYKEYSDNYEQERDEYKDQRDAYLATMIVFIVLTVVASGVGIFFIIKSRN